MDFGVLEMKMTLRRRYPNSSVRYINGSTRLGSIMQRGSKKTALTYLRSKKQLAELLAKRLNTRETLQTVLNKIGSTATEVEIVKAYAASARML